MRSEILAILKESGSSFVSGQDISQKFGITRAAVWKYIKQLQSKGYVIESVPKNGYRLIKCPDILTYDEIAGYLRTAYIGRRILHYDSIDSTNNKARELAEKGEPEGTVVISESQTKGKGKTGRQWYSEAYRGIWMSMILRPDIAMSCVNLITQIGCAAVGAAAENIAGDVQIKWPNDVLIHGKKFCGILTESSGEMDQTDYIIIGIGINVNQSENEFPEELISKATSLKIELKREIVRQELISDILNKFEKQYNRIKQHENSDEALDFCRTHSNLIGKTLLITRNGRKWKAQAMELNNQGQLMIRYEDGTTENIIAGEISVLQ